MKEFRIKKRHPLRGKESKQIADELQDHYGISLFGSGGLVEVGSVDGRRVIIFNKLVVAFYVEDELVPSVRGLMLIETQKRAVTVDMGAVKFIYNGADVMAAGIVEADPDIQVDDVVWVRDQNNKRPLAVGRALISGKEMVESRSGKAVRSIHHVGDPMWNLEL